LLARGALNVDELISHRFSVEKSPQAYELVAGGEDHLAILLEYGQEARSPKTSVTIAERRCVGPGKASVGLVGAGLFATRTLAPALSAAGARLDTVVSQKGASGRDLARKLGFSAAATNVEDVFRDAAIDTVVIATRHDSHSDLAARGLASGKHVFVEKPLGLNHGEIDRVRDAWSDSGRILHIGFNRRWAPQVVALKEAMRQVPPPYHVDILINAGSIPADHWIQRPGEGGGRVIGEMCHFLDLARHLAGTPVEEWNAVAMEHVADHPPDTVSVIMAHRNGSTSAVRYLANGNKGFPKERVEVFASGRVAVLDNFRRLRFHGWPGESNRRSWSQDKGHEACMHAFVSAVRQGGEAPIPWEEIEEVSRLAIDVAAAV
jgi:predicted dehydrogenase